MAELTKEKMREIRVAVDSALESVGASLGVQLGLGNGRFSESSGHFKLEVGIVQEDGEVITEEAQSFKQLCGMYDLKKEDLFAEFVDPLRKERYKLLGLRSRARKNVMLVENVATGKRYCMDHYSVQRGLAAAKAA